MRIIYFACFLLCITSAAHSQALSSLFIKGDYYQKPLLEFISEMENEHNLKFYYVESAINDVRLTGTFRFKTPFEKAFRQMLSPTKLSFYVNNSGIVIYERKEKATATSEVYFVLTGRVVDASSHQPLPYVNVYIPALSKGAVTDESGRFEIKPINEGTYSVRFHFIGYRSQLVQVDVDGNTDIDIALEETFTELEEVTVTPGSFEISTLEVSPMSLGKEEILHSPNFAKDIFRTLRTLPGVVNDDFSAKARIRGGHSSEVAVYLDNFEIKEPFHLEEVNGSFSIFNTDYVNELKVLTGGFSAKYTDRLSGIMDVHSYNYIEKDQANVFVDLLNMGATLQKKVGRANAFLAVRRGYLDWLLGEFESDGTLKPRFYDVWSKVNFEVNEANQVSLNFLFAKDNFLYDDVDQFSNRYLLQNLTLNSNIWLNWKWFPSGNIGVTTTAGYQEVQKDAQFKFVESVFDQNFDQKRSRAVQSSTRIFWDVNANHTLEMGVEGERFFSDYLYRELRYDIFETLPENVQLDTFFVDTKFDGYLLGGYVQDSWRPFEKVVVQPGLRISAQSFTERSAYWSPRVAVSYEMTDFLNMRLGFGKYYQPDVYYKIRTAQGQTRPFEKVASNSQYTASVNYQAERMSVQANVYFKEYDHLFDDYRFEFFNRIVGVNILDRPFHTTGGRSKGAEIMARKKYGNNLLMVSYALAENKVFNDRGEEAYRDFDQRHSVIVENIFRLPYHWNISLLWRFHSGHPYTPSGVNFVAQSDFSDRSIIFYEMGDKNSARLPSTHSLDLKIEKNWFFSRGKLTAYLNIVNMYDRTNIRSYWWDLYKRRGTGEVTTERDYQSNIPFFISPGISVTVY